MENERLLSLCPSATLRSMEFKGMAITMAKLG